MAFPSAPLTCSHRMLRLLVRPALSQGGGKRMAPTLTVSANGTAAPSAPVQASSARKERILRPMTADEEDYELARVRKNAGSNLGLKGKQSIAINRKSSERRYASYDQI